MRNIVLCNNPILKKKAEPIKTINGAIRQLAAEMAELMKKAEGIGIAAPQVGESIQLAVVEVPPDCGGTGRIVLINPRIISAYGSDVATEGCLSVPGLQVNIKRYREVTVETMNLDGKLITYKCIGLMARAIQHEIDHLNGILIIDKISPVKRLLIKRRISKMAEAKPRPFSYL